MTKLGNTVNPLPRLGLRIVRSEYRAIGRVEAEPRIFLGDEEYSARALSKQLSLRPDYVSLPQGRQIAAQHLQAAGLAGFGRAYDGTCLAPFPLSPEAVLWHDFASVPGPWQEIYPLPLTSPAQRPYAHLEWLRHWGFSGGLQGTLFEVGAPLVRWLKDYLERVPQARVLVVGSTPVQNYMHRLAGGGPTHRLTNGKLYRLGHLNFIVPELLDATPQLTEASWDIVCLVNAHMFLSDKHSKLVANLQTLPRGLFIGLFAPGAWQERAEYRIRCASLLGITASAPTHLIWHYLLRNPKEPVRPVPELPPIPLRLEGERERRANPGLAPYSFELRSFIRDAERFSQVAGSVAPFRPYYHQRPSYGTLDKRQLAWYLYWRQEAQHGRFLETGLDYIRLLALELVNGYGASTVRERYHLLEQLWLNYRQCFPSLDNWLPEWLCDYLLVNECPLDPLAPLLQAAKLGIPTHYPDLLLERFQADSWRAVPFPLLEQLLGISLEQSPVYTPDDRHKIADVVLGTLHNLDSFWKKQEGRGILARFRPPQARAMKRLPFSNVLFARATRLIYFGRYYPYSEQRGFLQLLLAIVKQTENLLRAERGYRGRVRTTGFTLPLSPVVEQTFHQSRPKAKVTIDPHRVKELLQQADVVRDLLLAESERGQTEPKSVVVEALPGKLATGAFEEVDPLPRESPHGLQEDTPYAQILSRLKDLEIQALATLLEDKGWERLIDNCQGKGVMPQLVVDRINAVAVEIQNDILIDTTSEPPTIVEEYLPEITAALKKLEAQKR